MEPNLYQFTNYRDYLRTVLGPRGKKKDLAQFITCQTTFLSNVLSGQANLSLEHAMRTCDFLSLSEKDAHYFMLIVHFGKAGTPALEAYYLKQIHALQESEENISNRISPHDTIPLEKQIILYNSWLYVAVHILCAVKEFQSRKALREYLHLPAKELDPVVDFLVQNGVLVEYNGQLAQGSTRIHLPRESPFLSKHHMNWRMKAIQSLDHRKTNDLHYSMVMSLSKNDVDNMKRIILQSIEKTDQLLKATGDEVVYAFCVDWFEV